MAGLPAPGAPEGQGLCLTAVQPSPHDGLAAPAPLRGRRCCLREAWVSPDFLSAGMCRAHHLGGFAWGLGELPGRDLRPWRWGPSLPFQRLRGWLRTLLPGRRPCLWGQAWTRPRLWCLISLPCWFVAQFIPGSWLMTDPTESQMVPPAESWNSRAPPACSPQAKPCFCHPEISLFQPPTSSRLVMAPLFVRGQSKGAQGMKGPLRIQDEHWVK